MNQRSNRVLNLLMAGYQPMMEEFIQYFGVSERTIRNDIKDLDVSLYDYGLSGINITEDGIIKFDKKLPEMVCFLKYIKSQDYYTYHLSREERKALIIMILFRQKSYLTIAQLSDYLGVSRNTLLKDMSELKNWFSKKGMILHSQLGKGYKVEAEEIKVRQEIMKIIQESRKSGRYFNPEWNVFSNLLIKEIKTNQFLLEIIEILKNEENETETYLSDYSFEEAVYELLVISERILKNKVLNKNDLKQWDRIQESSKYDFSKKVLDQTGKLLGFVPSKIEIAYYTTCLRRKSYIVSKSGNKYLMDIRVLIGKMIYLVAQKFEIYFYMDFATFDILIDHMRAAIHRIQSGEILVNPIGKEIQDTYPQIYNEVKERIKLIEEVIHCKFFEDEISFIVTYFAAVWEKSRAETIKKSIIPTAIVCTAGRGTAQLMLAKLKILDHIINVTEIMSVHNIQKIKKSGVQMVISTIPLDNIEIPYVLVSSPMVNQEDINKIQNMAVEIQKKKRIFCQNPVESFMGYEKHQKKESARKSLTQFFSPASICFDKKYDSWENAAKAAGILLSLEGSIKESQINEVIEYLKSNGKNAILCQGVIIAFLEREVKRESASLIRLKEPVLYSGEHPVFYFAVFGIQDGQSINHIIYNLVSLFGNKELRTEIDKVKTPEEMFAVMREMEKKYCEIV